MEDFSQEVYDQFNTKFEKNRKDLSTEIKTLIIMMRDINKLSELTVLSLSMRQRLLEDSHTLMIMHNQLINKKVVIKHDLFEQINNNMQFRTRNLTEKNIMVEGNIRHINVKKIDDLFNEQISFYTNSIKTVDHILYAIKNRMALEDLLGI